MSGQTEIAVELQAITKRFGSGARSVLANDEISLTVKKGTIHAIIGENGAGKSTAMKILYGELTPDHGQVLINGKKIKWRNSADAIARGVGMVHQHFHLAEPWSVLENVLLGFESVSPVWKKLGEVFPPLRWFQPVDFKGARQKVAKTAQEFGLSVRLDQKLKALSVGERQRVEILKLLYRRAEILILDEPTAVLTPQEVKDLFVQLKKLAATGKTILVITHKLKEVMAYADCATVFRAGKVVGETIPAQSSVEELAEMMVGRSIQLDRYVPQKKEAGEVLLRLNRVSVDLPEGVGLKDISFEVCRGEILGIAGVEGNGQSALLQCLANLTLGPTHGEVTWGHVPFIKYPLSYWRDRGLGFVPEDRHRQALLLEADLAENYILGRESWKAFSKWGFLKWKAIRKKVALALEHSDVRPRNVLANAGSLSGGNQQKFVMGREFLAQECSEGMGLLVIAQPTRGVDVGAIEFIHELIRNARDAGAAVLLVSSELDEVLALSDRILVFFKGSIVGSFSRKGGRAIHEQEVGLAMAGRTVGIGSA